jgi:hypothetical protein
VAEAGEAGVEKEQSPARREIRILHLAAPNSPQQIDEADHHDSVDWHAEERMRKATMMREPERRAAETAEDVQVWSFGGERERKRSQSSLAVEPGASQAGAGQEVGDGFQAVKRILWARVRECQLTAQFILSETTE